MYFLADLHIHSPYSRATSKTSNIAGLYAWARVKGIHLIGTGDFTHPGWFKELQDSLEPAEPGLFKLKNDKVPPAFEQVTPENINVRFVLTSEISSIYKRHDKVRKIHNILFAPDFSSVERMNKRLAAIGNIESDGRPILGLDSRNLLEIQLEEIPEGFLVPAHIWTPWFSLFGSKSGFDSIEECFGDLSSHIFALETGLSSDPDMNRLISALDPYTLISNSDCHSPGKLGREVNCFECNLDFFSMREALKDPGKGFSGTVEFFPEEGKYHMDGHRKCNVSLEPRETRMRHNICPVCDKPVTVGVSHRVMDLADRDAPFYPEGSPTFRSLIPLQEVIGEIMGRGPATKGVMSQYQKAINRFGSEFNILLNTPTEDIQTLSPLLAEAVKRIRTNKVIRQAGFDGQFGVIRVYEEGEIDHLSGKARLFDDIKPKKKQLIAPPSTPQKILFPPTKPRQKNTSSTLPATNPEQQSAIESSSPRIIVSAGPGTGKTFTLVCRILHLLETRKTPADKITAITFTNRAADEVKERLRAKAGEQGETVFVGTFHKFCLTWMQAKNPELKVIGDEDRALIIKKLFPHESNRNRKTTGRRITDFFLSYPDPAASHDEDIASYIHELKQCNAIDLEAIVPFFVELLETDEELHKKIAESVLHLFVDEFQDVNRAQFELVRKIGHFAKIFVIGDPNQAIYGFRGSDLNFFFRFAGEENTESLSLTRNYRSASHIIEAAAKLISHNRTRNDTQLAPQKNEHGEIHYYQAPSDKAEAEHVVKEIEKIMGGISSFSMNSGRSSGQENEYSFSDIAILYRLGRQADSLATALQRRGIPFQRVGGRPFFMEKDLRGLSLWILTAAEQAGFAEYLGLCREVPGIGDTTLSSLENNLSVTGNDFFKDALNLSLPVRSKTSLRLLSESLQRFRKESEQSLVQALQPVFNLFKSNPDSENGQRFLQLAGAFGALQPFATHLRENERTTIYDNRAEAVSLMTLHGSKGLEFPVVFLCGMDERFLPCQTGGCDIEEERRLCYVGLTRAKEKLFLSASSKDISRFMGEIPASLVIKTVEPRNKPTKKQAKQLKLF
ncbi:MAG: UvrD-helicase domain-containing protein [Desulfobulbaceae bacterium]|nr:UvrD-helicase domain-containing protein [Desulfobulbaceae bacterium]